jgi:hypothetical protein
MASLPRLLAASLATGRRGIPRISGREALQLAALAATELVAFNLFVLGAPVVVPARPTNSQHGPGTAHRSLPMASRATVSKTVRGR